MLRAFWGLPDQVTPREIECCKKKTELQWTKGTSKIMRGAFVRDKQNHEGSICKGQAKSWGGTKGTSKIMRGKIYTMHTCLTDVTFSRGEAFAFSYKRQAKPCDFHAIYSIYPSITGKCTHFAHVWLIFFFEGLYFQENFIWKLQNLNWMHADFMVLAFRCKKTST